MVFHLAKEADQKTQCPYCRSDLTGISWDSTHDLKLFYKTIDCSCGKTLHIRITDFIGSGHDSWDGTDGWKSQDGLEPDGKSDRRISTIEDKLNIVKELKGHSPSPR